MRSVPAIRCVSIRAQQERNVKVRFGVTHLKCNLDGRIQALYSLRREVICSLEAQTIQPLLKDFILRKQLPAPAIAIGSPFYALRPFSSRTLPIRLPGQ